jgi:hypothetical protein
MDAISSADTILVVITALNTKHHLNLVRLLVDALTNSASEILLKRRQLKHPFLLLLRRLLVLLPHLAARQQLHTAVTIIKRAMPKTERMVIAGATDLTSSACTSLVASLSMNTKSPETIVLFLDALMHNAPEKSVLL